MAAKTEIPEKFYRGGKQPKASTVGQLAKILAELPQNLKLDEPLAVVVFNYTAKDLKTIVGLEEDW